MPEMAAYEDPMIASMAEDKAERLRRLHFNLDHNVEEEPIAYCAFLLGEHLRSYCGPISKMLVSEVREGRLRAAGDLDRTRGGAPEKRRNPSTTPIDRDALRIWIERFGDATMRASAAGVWCGLAPLAAYEAQINGMTVKVVRVDGPIPPVEEG